MIRELKEISASCCIFVIYRLIYRVESPFVHIFNLSHLPEYALSFTGTYQNLLFNIYINVLSLSLHGSKKKRLQSVIIIVKIVIFDKDE